jgi:hypothetical protein
VTTPRGQAVVVERLRAEKPRVAIFLGPRQVGKWTVAEHYVGDILGIPQTHIMRVRSLTADDMSAIRRFANFGAEHGRAVIIRMHTTASALRPQLMVMLEESLPSTTFVLIAKDTPLKTVSDRGTVYKFASLLPDSVREILIDRGSKPADAKAVASYSAGSMDILWLAKQATSVKPVVQQALRAVHARDRSALELLAPMWNEEATQWLARWCAEAYTGRWRWYSSEFSEITDRAYVMRILLAISIDIRPALVVRSSLMGLIQEHR